MNVICSSRGRHVHKVNVQIHESMNKLFFSEKKPPSDHQLKKIKTSKALWGLQSNDRHREFQHV